MANMTFGVNILPKANADVSIGNSDNPWTIVSPELTGTPTAPTAAQGTNTTQIATTAFVNGAIKPMVVLSYGNSTWNDFINAYNDNAVVYCRASSNADPASGSQTRMAFMAYVNDGTSPTNVEFQYYRSVSSHSESQQGDQVFIYKLTNANGGTWTVTTREASTRIIAGSNISASYSNDKLTISANVHNGLDKEDAGYALDARQGKALNNHFGAYGYGTCATAAATTAKEATLANYELHTGSIVAIRFTYAVPASTTLNVNSKGAKAIRYRNAAIAANIIRAGDTATFAYDGTYYHLIAVDPGNMTWGQLCST